MISVQVNPELAIFEGVSCALAEKLESAAQVVVERFGKPPQADATIVLGDDEQLHDLNRTYLGIDNSTDVLAFPSGEVDPDTGIMYLGDVIISYPRAVSQASQGGHPIDAELQLLVVHGMLHLCGYDHSSSEEKREMWGFQAEILELLDCPIRSPAHELGSR